VLSVALLAGCGGSSPKLGDGRWYGKLISVDVSGRRLDFAPACRFARSGRWVAGGGEARFTVALAARPDLAIYFRPGGKAAAGHGQGASLGQLGRIAAAGPSRDLPPGWFVTVRNGTAASVVEDSGIQSSGEADRRTFACVWSKRTQAFVK
jgi:hypothetical protein